MEITEVTRRAIFDFLSTSGPSWCGRFSDDDFLARLCDLTKLPSHDHRFGNAAGDIYPIGRSMRKALFAALVLSLTTLPAFADSLTYRNDRFGTSATFPPELFDEAPWFAGNGDGGTWTSSAGARLAIWGVHNALEQTPETYADWLSESDGKDIKVTYRRVKDNWGVLSGYEDGRIFYRRYLFSPSGDIHNVEINYPETLRSTFDPLVGKIAESLTGP